MTSSGRRKKRRSRSGGGTMLGILVGLVVGLAIAVVAALFMTRSSVPFVDKARRAPDRPATEAGKGGELPDPNRPMIKGRTAAVDGGAIQPVAPPPPPAPAEASTDAQPPAATPGAAPAAAPAPAEAPTDAAGDRASYLLQAGAFKGQEDAEAMKAKLALVGFEARIVVAEVNAVTFYRVRVGPFGKIEDMNKARSRLAENGIEASVVRQR
jgi:cell division protein FtsN